MMPKARRSRSRKRDPNFVVLKVAASLPLLTLASSAVVKTDLLAISDDVEIISTDLVWTIEGLTPPEGPVHVGLAKSAYTVAQIAEATDASPTSRSDDVQLEHSRRRVRTVGTFSGGVSNESLNDGRVLRTRKLYWKLANADDLVLWAQNRFSAPLTTGADICVQGKIYARWT